ncbi:glucokinase [Candidatus Pseudothioglobus singularis PS1]|uniref:Glucokinase n=2 Tax=Candidatus Pseudothioglobus TaxID=2841677 RepID=A0A0M3T202_9GAMM|nr:glucokinase [Candidatus Pseudothioglobus singularis PS1]
METEVIKTQGYNLVGDIGGTNARFALLVPGESELTNIKTLSCTEFETVQEAMTSYLSSIQNVEINSSCIASAGTTHLDIFKPANNDWVINKADVSSALHNVEVNWINDFSAQALATSTLSEDDIVVVNQGNAQIDRVRLVIGPGTGLGTCGLIESSNRWIPLPAQGGHTDFAPNSDLEIEILKILKKQFGHVSVERILSGPGIVNLYKAICQINGRDIIFQSPSEVTSAAIKANSDLTAKETLNLFCKIFGSVTGTIALTTGCLGGIYITSDLVRNFLDFFLESDFLESFQDKGRLDYYMTDIPICISKKQNMGLIGSAYKINNL